MFLKLLCFAALLFSTAHSWDSGPAKCATSPCSGGISMTVALRYTDLKYDMWSPIHRLADCPPSYTNDGFCCRREGNEFDAPSHLAIPPQGFMNRLYHSGRAIDSYSKVCSTVAKKVPCKYGYIDMGCFCLRGAKLGMLNCKKDHYCDKNRGRCYRRCPKFYVNTGEKCVKSESVLGSEYMTCRMGELKYNTYCFPTKRTCPKHYEIWGSRCTRCYRNCPAGWFRAGVSSCGFRLRWRGNTHLWIAMKAIELLKTNPIGKRAYKFMMSPVCRSKWMEALSEASEYTSRYTAMHSHSHYWNPSGLDYLGKPTSYTTYPDIKNKNPTNAANIINTYLNKLQISGCSALGKALHHVIDLTMPAHSSGFGPLQTPEGLLAALEAYVPSIQKYYPPNQPWDGRWMHLRAMGIVKEIAKASNRKYAVALFQELLKEGPVCKMTPPLCYQSYTGYCFVNDPKVKVILGDALRDAYQGAASWLFSICTVRNWE